MSKVMSTYLPKGTHRKLNNIAKTNGISKTEAIKVFMNEDFEKKYCSRAGCITLIEREVMYCNKHSKAVVVG